MIKYTTKSKNPCLSAKTFHSIAMNFMTHIHKIGSYDVIRHICGV